MCRRACYYKELVVVAANISPRDALHAIIPKLLMRVRCSCIFEM